MTLTDDFDKPDSIGAPSTDPARRPWIGYPASLAMTGLATLLAALADAQGPVPNVSLIFVLPVVIAAVTWGWGPAIVSALTGVMAFNFFLIEPRFTLRVSDPSNVWAMVLLLAVAAIISAVAARSRQRAVVAQEQADQYATLQVLARSLVGASGRATILRAASEALSGVFRAPVCVLFEDEGTLLEASGQTLSAADLEAANWALASRLATRSGAYPAEDAKFDFWPMVTPSRLQFVIGVDLGQDSRPADPGRLIDIIGGYLAMALERDVFADGMLRARLAEEGEKVKADLLAAVSHDLRTPLSTILVSLQSLRAFGETHDAETRDQLLASAELETARLARMVVNLLDMSRVDSGALKAAPISIRPAQLVTEVLQRMQTALAPHPVVNRVADLAPNVLVDVTLTEGALVNVLENAAKYSQPAASIEITTTEADGYLSIDVYDQGPGFNGSIEPLFEKFARGIEGDGRQPGTGLGLAIARGYLTAQGGRIEAANRDDGRGARVRLFLPLAPVMKETTA